MINQIYVKGVTTEMDRVPKMLGVSSENEYGLYQETEMGKYYAKFAPNGSFDNALVRVISHEQAKKLESKICAVIEKESTSVKEALSKIPTINSETITNNMEQIHTQVSENSANISKKIRKDMDSFSTVAKIIC